MISRIRMRIFIPVLILTITFPALSWIIFGSASGWYMNRLSRQSLSLLMDSIESTAERLYAQQETMDRSGEKDLSKELMGQVKSFIRKDKPQATLLALNSRLKLTYPKRENYQPDTLALYEICREMANTSDSAGDAAEIREISLGESRYLVSLYVLGSSVNVRGKYLFGYIQVPATGTLLSYAGGLLLLIAGFLCLLSLAAVWFIAGSISRPLQALCRHTHNIGKGHFSPVNEKYSISELEELRCSVNRMTEELEQLNTQQTAFFQNASHELRTPLMSICGYAQGIQCNVFPNHEEAAGIILSETMRMKELVDSILTISKMDSRHLDLAITGVDLDEFVKEELDMLKGIALTQGICLEGETGGRTITAAADPALLSRAFRNVISNCARYAAETVRVEITALDQWACITITDDGPGFREKDLPYIFDRFYKGADGNFGIGLSVVRTAMEYMGGRSEAGNRVPPGRGAVFYLYLPLM